MPWPLLPVGTKLAVSIWTDIKGYIDAAAAAALPAGGVFTPAIKFGATAHVPSASACTYQQVGKRVWASYLLTLGATAPAVGTLTVTLPVSARNATLGLIVGAARLQDLSAGTVLIYNVRSNTATDVMLQNDAGAIASNAIPWTWASGDTLRLSLEYEAL